MTFCYLTNAIEIFQNLQDFCVKQDRETRVSCEVRSANEDLFAF
jgi:hypothetical protein